MLDYLFLLTLKNNHNGNYNWAKNDSCRNRISHGGIIFSHLEIIIRIVRLKTTIGHPSTQVRYCLSAGLSLTLP
jgi:hypothetical protein